MNVNSIDLKDKNILLISHTLIKAAAQELEEYLVGEKVKNLLFVGHPLPYGYGKSIQDRRTEIKHYQNGELIYHKKTVNIRLPEPLQYGVNFFSSVYYGFKAGIKFDLMIGLNNLNAVSCLVLKYAGRGDRVCYYIVDYFRSGRFSQKFLDRLYFFLDRVCVEKGDYMWNCSPYVIKGREEKGISPKHREKQVYVPIGTKQGRIISSDFIDKYRVVYLGNIAEEAGVPLLVDAIPEIINKVPNAHFLFIGGGEYEDEAKKRVIDMKLQSRVEFKGVVDKREELDEILSKGGIGVAIYKPFFDNHSYFADPGKVKDYISFGLPVVITRFPYIAEEIEKRKCGYAVGYDKNELVNAILDLLGDDKMYLQQRNNALLMAEDYLWSNVFKNALMKIFTVN